MKTNDTRIPRQLNPLALTTALLFLVACTAPATPPPTETLVPTPTQWVPPTATPTTTPTTPSREIVLAAPEESTVVNSPVKVEGRVSVMPFEANLRGRVYDAQGRVVGEEPIQVRPDVEGELGGPGTFSGAIPFEIESAGPGRVEVAEISARDGSVVVSATVVVTLTTSAAALPDLTPPPRGWIAFKTPEEQLALTAPDGSRGVTVTKQAEVGSFAWSPDGRSLAFVRDGQVMLLSIEDNRVISLTGPGTIRSPELAWSHDSRRLAYLHSLEKGSQPVAPDALRVLDVAAREAVTVSTYSNTRPEEKAVICPQPFTYPVLPVTSPWSKTVQIWDCRDAEVVGELHTASYCCDYLWLPDTEAIVLAKEETDKAGIEWTCLEDTQDCMKGETKVTHPTSVAVWRTGDDATGKGALAVVLEGTQTRHYYPTRWLSDGRLEVMVREFDETTFEGPAQPARVTYTYLSVTEDGRLQEVRSSDLPWWAAGGFRERFEATDLHREQDRERPVIPGWEVGPDGESVAFGWSRQIDAEEWERVIYVWQGEGEPRRLTTGLYPQWQPEVGAPSEQVRRVWSPDGQWTAIVDEAAGSLTLEGPDGATSVILPEGSTVGAVTWAPDGKLLLVERTNWLPPQDDQPQASGPPEIWVVRIADGTVEPAALLFRPDAEEVEEQALGGLAEVVFGRWAPDGRHIFLWIGTSGSIRADGNAPWVLDTATGEAVRPADWALVNSRYYSWAPDSSALAITAGGGRSAQVNKWLNIVDLRTGEVTTVISKTEQVPGIVAWPPISTREDRIAYAAVPAEKTGKAHASLMTFENPAIAARRIYLLDPGTGEYRRLNDVAGYQDVPVWSKDGERLYYVQRDRETETLVLMVADPATGEARPIEASRRPAPPDTRVGYYGQAAWDEVLSHLPDDATWEPDSGASRLPESPDVAIVGAQTQYLRE